jgi:hypothetical protein
MMQIGSPACLTHPFSDEHGTRAVIPYTVHAAPRQETMASKSQESGLMATRPKQGEEQTKNEDQGSTPQLDRLEKLANAASTAAQARQWRARQNGMQDLGEPSEVRSLNHDAEAKAQAEAAMQQMMAKSKGKGRGR